MAAKLKIFSFPFILQSYYFQIYSQSKLEIFIQNPFKVAHSIE